MHDRTITEHTRNNSLRDFDAGISKLRYELAKNLAETDILKSDKLENVTSVFNERLLVFQHDFLQMLAQIRGDAPNKTNNLNLKAKGGSHLPKVVGGIAGAAAGSTAAGMIVTTATGMWWWYHPAASLATVLATGAGVSVDLVSGGLTLGGGVIGAIAVNKLVAGGMRKRIRKRIMSDFDSQIVTRLKSWAEGLLDE